MRTSNKPIRKRASLKRETSIDEMGQRVRHRKYIRESFNLFAHHLKAERKKTRELKREVTRLNALVIKLAEKI